MLGPHRFVRCVVQTSQISSSLSEQTLRTPGHGRSLMQLEQNKVQLPLTEFFLDICVCLFAMLLSLQNLSLSQLQEDHRRDLLCLPLSSTGRYPGPPAPPYQV